MPVCRIHNVLNVICIIQFAAGDQTARQSTIQSVSDERSVKRQSVVQYIRLIEISRGPVAWCRNSCYNYNVDRCLHIALRDKEAVVTYVICFSRVAEPVTELAEGINVYRVRVIRMRGREEDKVFAGLEEKRRNGGKVQKAELVPLLLTPLMSSRLSVRERIVKSLEILQEEEAAVTGLEMEKMQAVLYTFADKFLSAGDLEQVKEMIAMTRLGQMLVEDGIARGIEQGIALTKRVLRLSAKGFTRDQIAEDCGIGRKEVDDILREEEDL